MDVSVELPWRKRFRNKKMLLASVLGQYLKEQDPSSNLSSLNSLLKLKGHEFDQPQFSAIYEAYER